MKCGWEKGKGGLHQKSGQTACSRIMCYLNYSLYFVLRFKICFIILYTSVFPSPTLNFFIHISDYIWKYLVFTIFFLSSDSNTPSSSISSISPTIFLPLLDPDLCMRINSDGIKSLWVDLRFLFRFLPFLERALMLYSLWKKSFTLSFYYMEKNIFFNFFVQ